MCEFIKQRTNLGLESNSYFYCDSNDHEVDLLIKSGNQLIPVEIKSSKTFHPEFLKGLRYFKDMTKDRCTPGYLIYAGEREQRIQDFFVTKFSHIKHISEIID